MSLISKSARVLANHNRRSAISKLQALREAKSIVSATHDGQALETIQ
jgi:hypothetical protein